MNSRGLLRTIGIAVLPATLLLGLPAVATAGGGGGGCIEATTGEGTAVTISEACFGPTTLHVDPGATVTFSNDDPYLHNVVGTLWGFGDVKAGRAFTATFPEPGVYPYACTYHWGMTGVVVVGDDLTAGDGTTVRTERLAAGAAAPVSVSPVAEPVAAPADEQAATAPEATSGDGVTPWFVPWIAAGLALALGIGIGFLLRRPRHVPASA